MPQDIVARVAYKYGDWRDYALEMGMPLAMQDNRYARPVCPIHDWLHTRSKGNRFVCLVCGWVAAVDKEMLRQWRKEQSQKATEEQMAWFRKRAEERGEK